MLLNGVDKCAFAKKLSPFINIEDADINLKETAQMFLPQSLICDYRYTGLGIISRQFFCLLFYYLLPLIGERNEVT